MVACWHWQEGKTESCLMGIEFQFGSEGVFESRVDATELYT